LCYAVCIDQVQIALRPLFAVGSRDGGSNIFLFCLFSLQCWAGRVEEEQLCGGGTWYMLNRADYEINFIAFSFDRSCDVREFDAVDRELLAKLDHHSGRRALSHIQT